MSVKFEDKGHKYTSTGTDQINWTSVTSAIHRFVQPFDSDAIAASSSLKRKSKWFGMPVDEIQKIWKQTNTYSLELGTWYHKLMEDAVLSHDTISVSGTELAVVPPIIVNDEKFARDQRLDNNKKYPEHLVFLKSAGICGQADDIEVINHQVNVNDYKTNKEIKLQSFKSWDKGHQMMQPPFHHLQDCNFVHYSLQLSMYLYIILKHNPQLKPGKITIKHILFEESGRDQYDYPIYRKDEQGNFIIKDTQDYDVAYMKAECQTLTNWLKDNPKK